MKQEMQDELNDMGSSLGGQRTGVPFSVPSDYFSTLSERVMMAAQQEHVGSVLPAPEHPYNVPSGYFEELPTRINNRVAEKRKMGLFVTFGTLRWAAAAVLLVMVSAAGYIMMNSGIATTYESGFLASVADDDIQNYLGYAYQADAVKSLPDIKLDVAPSDIEEYLDETGWGSEYY
jgi:hypothetical protein